jgi:hypothetical protein
MQQFTYMNHKIQFIREHISCIWNSFVTFVPLCIYFFQQTFNYSINKNLRFLSSRGFSFINFLGIFIRIRHDMLLFGGGDIELLILTVRVHFNHFVEHFLIFIVIDLFFKVLNIFLVDWIYWKNKNFFF